MIELDRALAHCCHRNAALYRRYSDDILFIVEERHEQDILDCFRALLIQHRLCLQEAKTHRIVFDQTDPEVFQYLGFSISPVGAVIRPSSLARQGRKLKRGVARIAGKGAQAIAEGKAKKIYTKKLRKRFSPVGARNFSAYARRADQAFGSKKISRQVRKLERRADCAIRDLNRH